MGSTLVRVKVRQWKSEKVANGSSDTVRHGEKRVREMRVIARDGRRLTVHGPTDKPIRRQQCILHIVIHQQPLEVRGARELPQAAREADGFLDDDRV